MDIDGSTLVHTHIYPLKTAQGFRSRSYHAFGIPWAHWRHMVPETSIQGQLRAGCAQTLLQSASVGCKFVHFVFVVWLQVRLDVVAFCSDAGHLVRSERIINSPTTKNCGEVDFGLPESL